MLHNIKELYGHKLAASDGEIGKIKDFYFDDRRWAVRYLIADTGSWLTDRLVLISPHAFGHLDRETMQLHVDLTRSQIENSPPIDAQRPVSRQFEEDYYTYYGWPTYWMGDLMWGAASSPMANSSPPDTSLRPERTWDNDLHLRSTHAVKGYDIQATDGPVGSVSSFLVDDQSWAVTKLVVETGHWYSGKEILISPSQIARISYEESKVFVNLTKSDILHTMENDVARAGA